MAAQVVWNGLQYAYNVYVQGYQVLNDANIATIEGEIVTLDAETTSNTTAIGVNSAAIVIIEAEIAGLTSDETISGVSIANLAGSIQNDENNIVLLGSFH